jgi:hypothetical protein
MCIKINKIGKQEVGIWWVQKCFQQYGVPIWSLWPNIRFLPSIVAEKHATKNEHICSMCIKIYKVGKQEVGIRWVQKRFPRYGVPIWSLWPNIRFLPSIVAEKNVTKNVHIRSILELNNVLEQRLREPKWQSRIENPETQATSVTKHSTKMTIKDPTKKRGRTQVLGRVSNACFLLDTHVVAHSQVLHKSCRW